MSSFSPLTYSLACLAAPFAFVIASFSQSGETVSLQSRRATLNSTSRPGREHAAFDFTTGENRAGGDGDFYYYSGRPSRPTARYASQNLGQRGLIDLGAIEFDPTKISIPSGSYLRNGVDAIPGHIYVALPKEGQDNRYILIQCRTAEDDKSLLDYYVVDTGLIKVNAGIAEASFELIGPKRSVGIGKSWELDRVLIGEYTIVYNQVDGYITPPSEQKLLTRGGVAVFEGNYTKVEDSPSLRTDPPNSKAKESLRDPLNAESQEGKTRSEDEEPWHQSTEIIAALIGTAGVVVAALIAMKKRA